MTICGVEKFLYCYALFQTFIYSYILILGNLHASHAGFSIILNLHEPLLQSLFCKGDLTEWDRAVEINLLQPLFLHFLKFYECIFRKILP